MFQWVVVDWNKIFLPLQLILTLSIQKVKTNSQSANLSWCQAPIWGPKQDFYHCQTVASLLMWGALSDERTGLSFATAADPRQRSHSQVRVPRDSWPYFTTSNSRLPQPGEPGPRIYIPQEQGGTAIPPGTGFPCRRLLHSQGYGGGIRTRLHARVSIYSPLLICYLSMTICPIEWNIKRKHKKK
jgi:hypothetical protein